MLIEQVRLLGKEELRRIYTLLLEAYPVTILKYLIYYDENYSYYLEEIIDDYPNNIFFIARKEGQLIGFAHFKIIEDDLFLNNIVVEKAYRGKGLGKHLLSVSITQVKEVFNLQTFSLDVFSKNDKAFKWYKSIGLKEVKKTNWYDVKPVLEENDVDSFNSNNLTMRKDDNGFNGFYIDDIKVASIIRNETLIFRSIDSINILKGNKYKGFSNFCLISENTKPFNLIGVSNRLSVNIEMLKLH